MNAPSSNVQLIASNEEITIRRAETVDDYRACQDAQRRAWGIAEDGYVVPIATMVGANQHGGLVLGAFLNDGTAVAMSFAFLGRLDGRLCLYSQLTGVAPGHQSRGLGHKIKMAQRAWALAEGIGRIVWAFDPLQAGNAHFNLARLGATARRYVDDMYGRRTDTLNQGVPTDRLIAEWDLAAEPRQALAPDLANVAPRLIDTGPEGAPADVAPVLDSSAPLVLLEVPVDIAGLRRERPELAEAWRRSVREAFHAAFRTGRRAVDFLRTAGAEGQRAFYVLEREA